jgi:hypothetical protein
MPESFNTETVEERVKRFATEGLVATSATAESIDDGVKRRTAALDGAMTDADIAGRVKKWHSRWADSDLNSQAALNDYARRVKEKEDGAGFVPPLVAPLTPSPMTITPPGEQPSGTAEEGPTTL